MAHNWTIQTWNQLGPLLAWHETVVIGLGVVTGKFKNMDPLSHNWHRSLPLLNRLGIVENRPKPPKFYKSIVKFYRTNLRFF